MRLTNRIPNPLPAAVMALAVAILLFPAVAGAYTVDILPTADASFLDNNTDGTFDELRLINPFGLQTTYFIQGVNRAEVRSVLEYQLPAIPSGMSLLSASFIASVEGTQTPFNLTQLSMHLSGYSGDGQITFADITTSTTPIGTFVDPDPLGLDGTIRYSAPLNLGYVSSALTAGGFLGIMTNSDLGAGSISVHSLEGYYPLPDFAGTESVLRLQFVPEPASISLLLAALLGSFSLQRRR